MEVQLGGGVSFTKRQDLKRVFNLFVNYLKCGTKFSMAMMGTGFVELDMPPPYSVFLPFNAYLQVKLLGDRVFNERRIDTVVLYNWKYKGPEVLAKAAYPIPDEIGGRYGTHSDALDGLPPTHPGEVLSDLFLRPAGWDLATYAEDAGIEPSRFLQLCAREIPLDRDLAEKLYHMIGHSAELLFRMQAAYDFHVRYGKPMQQDELLTITID